MQAANDGAVSLAQELELAQDDLESKRLIFGEHHMTVAVYARSQAALDDIAAEIRNISATSGINLISEAFGARAHFMAQHPGNTGARSRKAAITNHNFADLATFHRTPLGKTGERCHGACRSYCSRRPSAVGSASTSTNRGRRTASLPAGTR